MLDPNFTHIKFNNFAEHYIQQIREISDDYLPEGFLGVDTEEVDEELVLMIQKDKIGKYSINIEGIHFGVNVYISPPAKKMFDVHIDRDRKIGFNFPIQVDPEKGYLLVMKDDNYDALGEYISETSNIKWGDKFLSKDLPGHKKWINAKESDFRKIKFDKPILLNTQRPHSYVNYSNQFRIIASLNTNKEPDEVYQALSQFV